MSSANRGLDPGPLSCDLLAGWEHDQRTAMETENTFSSRDSVDILGDECDSGVGYSLSGSCSG